MSLNTTDVSRWELSNEKRIERILITHIFATDVIAGLDRVPAGVYVSLDINAMITKTSIKPVLIDAKDTMGWDQEIFLPSERSSTMSLKVYASFGVGPTPGNDELLCEFKTTVGELLDRDGQLQLPKGSEDSSSCPSLRIILERRDCSLNHGESATSVSQHVLDTRFNLSQALLSLFNTQKHSNSGSLNAKAGHRLFALIVAIDKYKSHENQDLLGCNHDGKSFKRFLTSMLGVPSSQIVFLADENATRQAILAQFDQHLIENTNIERGDAMVFFFAGHGSRQEAPQGWVAEGNKIEAICPYDEKTIDSDGKEIYAIPDRTINTLIQTLAERKGNNIIAIFDCCHSGGATRNEASSVCVRSTSASPRPPPPDLDQEIWKISPEASSRGAKSVTGLYKVMESHVCLAACLPDEVAFGDWSGGFFTSALVKALSDCSLHDTTYSHLFEQLHIKENSQHPQCLGANKGRLLFSLNTMHSGETTFRVSQRGNNLYASAGSIHGVVVGTEFAVTSGIQTVILKSVEVDAFECLLERGYHLDFTASPPTAVVSNWNHPTLRVHSSLHPSHSGAHFTIVPADNPADVVVHQKISKWEIERIDPLIPIYSSGSVIVDTGARRLDDVLNFIANFNSYLYRPDRAGGSFAGEIKVRLNRVERGDMFYPTEKDYDYLDVPTSSSAGMEVKEATITDLDAGYCLTLENFSDVDLFPYLFYFDPSDYSIQEWYLPPSSNMHPPLERCRDDGQPSLFAYGYGGFGTDPIEFYLPPGRTIDSGFLKIFLTTTYVDMSNVKQASINEMRSCDPSPSQMSTRKGIWECRTFVLTCKTSGSVAGERA